MDIDKEVREMNEYVLNETQKIIKQILADKECLEKLKYEDPIISEKVKYSSPLLLTSTKKYIENYKESSILYIGQETNGWVNNNIPNPTIEDIEDYYEQDVLIQKGGAGGYWKLMHQEALKQQKIIRSNMLLMGRKLGKGKSYVNEDLQKIYLEYFEFIYKYLSPKKIVISGCVEKPYYDIAKEMLKIIKSEINLEELRKKSTNLLSDNKKDIHCTYHGQYLLQKKELDEVYKKIYHNN